MAYFYATTSSLETRMPDIEFDTATTSLAQECITDAEAEVNKWLSKRYDLSSYQTTTADIPPLMRSLTLRLAQGYFWEQNSRGSKESLTRSKGYIQRVMDNLAALAESKANLLDTAGSIIADDPDNSSTRVLCSTSDFKATFNEGKSRKWKVDPDKIDAIDDGDL